jgi:hypothetical protein
MKMLMKFSVCLMALIFSCSCLAQTSTFDFEKELDFLLYLGQNGQQADVDFYGNRLLSQKDLNKGQKDSLNFFMGIINFKQLNYDGSIKFLSKVSGGSIFYPKSTFYSEICFIEKNKYATAFNHLKDVTLDKNNELLQQLKTFELAGLSLLKRDYKSFDSLSVLFNTNNIILNNEQQLQKKEYYPGLKNLKRKSPFLAGTLSAIVPGLGLVYAGNNGQALSDFLQVAALGAIGAETYIKLGPRNPQFIISASLFTFFYLGNIWGSVLCVQIIKNEKFKEFDNNIMVGLRIPIDNFFK